MSKRKKTAVRPLAIVLYVGVFAVVVAIVAVSSKIPTTDSSVASVDIPVEASGESDYSRQTSVNEVVATAIAADVAETANLPIANNVANLSVSLAAEREVAASNSAESVTKQDIMQSSDIRRETVVHVVKKGETIAALAKEYGVSKETIKWANDLTSDKLATGKKLTIPPVDGVMYKVQSGDTLAKLAKKYKSSKERIVAFNDLELTGLKKGAKIVIPAGKLPENERPGYEAPTPPATYPSDNGSSGSSSGNFMEGSVGNKYAYGYCTWYAYEQRAAMGKPIGSFWGNANTWAVAARAQGFTVSNIPIAGAVFQTSAGGGGYGHVGIIESVKNGMVTYSDMNGGAGWNRIGRATIPLSQAQAQWVFIY